MRTWNGILATALAGAVLFSSCRKQDMNQTLAATPNAHTGNQKPVVPDLGALLTFKVSTVLSPENAEMSFNEGGINVSSIALDATEQRGNAVQLVYFDKPITTPYYPLYGPIDLGALNIPKAMYLAYTFSVRLVGNNQNDALVLNGSYASTNSTLPPAQHPAAAKGLTRAGIRLIVNQPVVLKGQYMPSMLIDRQDYYTATIFLDPAVVFSGISIDMLDHADHRNGQVIISSESNPRLYQIVIQNLARAMRMEFVLKDPNPSA